MELPRFVEIEQKLHGRRVGDLPAAVAKACEEAGLRSRVAPGNTVAITVGSRGIANMAEIAAAVVRVVKDLGGQPFLLPAMGSHGGSTAEGQTELLASLGVTPASVGAPIRADMTAEQVGETSNGVRVFAAREALRADRVIVLNRVKQHTDFEGEYESGLMKMLAIGVGKRDGAMAMHGRLCASLREDLPQAAHLLLRALPVAAGLAILENGYNDTAEIVGLAPEEIPEREKELLRRARRNAAKLPFKHIDLLLVDRLGKDVSGIGMDSHVLGRRMLWEEPNFRGGPNIRLVAALDLTEASHGNPLGIGLADLMTERLRRKIDEHALKMNVLHTGWLNRAKLPLCYEDDRAVLQAAFIALGRPDPKQARLLRITDTLHLGRMWISEGFLPEAQRHAKVTVLGELQPLAFNARGEISG
jgi:hypothetical protein